LVPEPPLSIIIGSNGARGSVERCLGALEEQRDGAEVIVCEPSGSGAEVQRRFPWARFIELPGAVVPELWREGIDRSRGGIVALTISPMLPAPDWIKSIVAEQDRHDVVAGAIEPGPGLRLVDSAEYLCRYARDMLPFEAHECVEHLPGDNAAYKRELLERRRELYRDGFWEPVVNRRLAEEGTVLWHSPELIVGQGRSAGTGAFVQHRYLHGRAHGRKRGARFGTRRNIVGALAAPVVPLLLSVRIMRTVFAKRRYRARALLSLPFILLFNVAWAAGEALGHLDALRRR
jgi:hypothetical protein